MFWAVFLSLLISGSAPLLVFNAMGLTELDFSHHHRGQRMTVSSCAEGGAWPLGGGLTCPGGPTKQGLDPISEVQASFQEAKILTITQVFPLTI